MKKIDISKFISKYATSAGAFSTPESVTFNGSNFQMEVRKDGYDCRPIESKWYNNIYLRLSAIAICEIMLYILAGRTVYDDWYLSTGLVALFLLVLIYMHAFGDSKNLRMNHGAEHKVIGAFKNHDLKNADKYSRFSDRCGGNIVSMMIILMLVSPIIKFPFTIFLIYVTVYMNIKSVRWIFFNTIGMTIQYLTTAEPTKEILENTKNGFEKLVCVERKKFIEDLIKDANISNEGRLIYIKAIENIVKDDNMSSEERLVFEEIKKVLENV